ncbi:hypothetical protein D3C71_1977520 [compost metagenome]
MSVSIPANTSAEIFIPAVNADEILENGKGLDQIAGLNSITQTEGAQALQVGSGNYCFTFPWV